MSHNAVTAKTPQPQNQPETLSLPNLLNTVIEPGLYRSAKGPLVLLHMTNIDTHDTQTVLWDNAPAQLKVIARRLAVDPLGVIARYADVAVKPDDQNPPANPARVA